MATRPTGEFAAANGLGMTVGGADLWLNYLQRNFSLLPDPPDLHEQWRKVVTGYGITGRKSHDARIAAAMQAHGVAELLTFNGQDFKRFPFIRVIDPRTV